MGPRSAGFFVSIHFGGEKVIGTILGILLSIRMFVPSCILGAQVSPLGRVFKIHNILLHGFIGCLLSVSGMLLWVTPLGVR